MAFPSCSQTPLPLSLWLGELDQPRGRDQARLVLAGWKGLPPTEIVMNEGPKGRPGVESPWGMDFCVSHADRVLGIAAMDLGAAPEMTGGRDRMQGPGNPGFPGLGLDLEILRPERDFTALGQAVLSPLELEWFASLEGMEARMTGFYRLWTWKEAWLKARGLSAWDLAQAPDHPVTAGHDHPPGLQSPADSTCLEWLITPDPGLQAGKPANGLPLQVLACLCMPPGVAYAGPAITMPESWKAVRL